jgi:voltage-gated potassium channel
MFSKLKKKIEAFLNNEDLKQKIYMVVYDTDTHWGRMFDVLLLSFIVVSVMVVILESLSFFPPSFRLFLTVLEWMFTVFFTIEYLLRLYCAPKVSSYALSFWGVVDLLSTLPTYLSVIFPAAHGLLTIRVFRLLRVFRVFKLFSYWREGEILLDTLKASSKKITVFFLFVLLMATCVGTVMYMFEGGMEGSSFYDIPSSIYWAIVTMTTVGYGDITPVTSVGRFLSAVVMLLGYTVLAVPTGIVSAQMIAESNKKKKKAIPCPHCHKPGNDDDAEFCKYCGKRLDEDGESPAEEEPIITMDGEIK